MKKILKEVFYNVKSKKFVIVNDFLAFLTLISIAGFILETVEELNNYHNIFFYIEYLTVFFFSIEYLGRIIATEKPLKYIFSFFGIFDLLAIIPTYIGLTNLTFLKGVRIFRILRFLRMMRILKIMRVQKAVITNTEEKLKNSIFRNTVQIYVMLLFSAIIVSGSLIWFVEGYRDVFASIPLAMLWSSKVLLGGIVSDHAQTISGQIITIVTRFVGLILFGLLLTVVGGFIKKIFFGSENIDN